jgi:rod shape determining protein RodA
MSLARVSGRNIDWITFSIYLALIFIGWAMIYAVGYGQGYPSNFIDFLGTPVGKQLIWVAISLFVFFTAYTIEWQFWRTFASAIYILSLLMLLAVLVFGKNIKGATSWFDLGGGITIQPSEFAKFATCLAFANYLGSYTNNLRSLKTNVFAIGLLSAPAMLILLQPDAGSAIVFISFFIVLYREGFPGIILGATFSAAFVFILGLANPPEYIILGLGAIGLVILLAQWKKKKPARITFFAVVALSVFAIIQGYIFWLAIAVILLIVVFGVNQWIRMNQSLSGLVLFTFLIGSGLATLSNFAFNNVLKPHQRERINVWLKPDEAAPQGAAYNLNHSKMAIGSGGFWGKGFLQGNFTQGNFVPEQITDFIFCAVGEEHGFLGTIVIFGLFLVLLWRILYIAERQRNDFNRLYAYGVAGIIFIHFFVNIGMTMGVMPIIGIPLPFLSKGGSSLLGFTLMICVLLKLDASQN